METKHALCRQAQGSERSSEECRPLLCRLPPQTTWRAWQRREGQVLCETVAQQSHSDTVNTRSTHFDSDLPREDPSGAHSRTRSSSPLASALVTNYGSWSRTNFSHQPQNAYTREMPRAFGNSHQTMSHHERWPHRLVGQEHPGRTPRGRYRSPINGPSTWTSGGLPPAQCRTMTGSVASRRHP